MRVPIIEPERKGNRSGYGGRVTPQATTHHHWQFNLWMPNIIMGCEATYRFLFAIRESAMYVLQHALSTYRFLFYMYMETVFLFTGYKRETNIQKKKKRKIGARSEFQNIH